MGSPEVSSIAGASTQNPSTDHHAMDMLTGFLNTVRLTVPASFGVYLAARSKLFAKHLFLQRLNETRFALDVLLATRFSEAFSGQAASACGASVVTLARSRTRRPITCLTDIVVRGQLYVLAGTRGGDVVLLTASVTKTENSHLSLTNVFSHPVPFTRVVSLELEDSPRADFVFALFNDSSITRISVLRLLEALATGRADDLSLYCQTFRITGVQQPLRIKILHIPHYDAARRDYSAVEQGYLCFLQGKRVSIFDLHRTGTGLACFQVNSHDNQDGSRSLCVARDIFRIPLPNLSPTFQYWDSRNSLLIPTETGLCEVRLYPRLHTLTSSPLFPLKILLQYRSYILASDMDAGLFLLKSEDSDMRGHLSIVSLLAVHTGVVKTAHLVVEQSSLIFFASTSSREICISSFNIESQRMRLEQRLQFPLHAVTATSASLAIPAADQQMHPSGKERLTVHLTVAFADGSVSELLVIV